MTRPKSPKLSRRKSCGDIKRGSTLDEKGKENQHTLSSYKGQRRTAASSHNKVQISEKNRDGTAENSRVYSDTVMKDTNIATPKALTEERRKNITVNG